MKLLDAQMVRSWRTWVIGGYVLIVLLLAGFWGFSLLAPIDQIEEEQQYQSLESIARAGAVMLENSDISAQEAVDKLDNSQKLRITLVDAEGEVLSDSADDALHMQNHAARPEVSAALQGQVGHDTRVSNTDGTEYLYVAVPATYQKTKVALRVCTPVSEVESLAQSFRTTSLMVLCIAIILTVFVAYVVLRRAEKPVNRLERVRTDFVANASHELKTPVAGIKLLSESIEKASESGDTEMIPVFTERLKKESERLQNLVTELLDLSRLENGGLEGRGKETCDLASIVSTSYEGHLRLAEEKHLEFTYDDQLPSDASCRINLPPADASLLVDNLLENAISYTDKGSVRATLSGDGTNIVFEVADTGIGIPAADQERIFERFYRVDKGHSRELGGTGLGLSLVRHAANRAGGKISLRSRPGKGSTFTVTLPRA